MPLPLTVSCFSKIQVGFTFLVPAQIEHWTLFVFLSTCLSCTEYRLVYQEAVIAKNLNFVYSVQIPIFLSIGFWKLHFNSWTASTQYFAVL